MSVSHKTSYCLFLICASLSYIGCNQKPSVNNESPPKTIKPSVGKIIFGEGFKEGSEVKEGKCAFEIIKPNTTFRPNDRFALLVISEEPFGKTKVEFILSFITEKGTEYFALRETIDVSNPSKRCMANRYSKIKQVMRGKKFGKYILRLFRDDVLLAEGEFSYLAK